MLVEVLPVAMSLGWPGRFATTDALAPIDALATTDVLSTTDTLSTTGRSVRSSRLSSALLVLLLTAALLPLSPAQHAAADTTSTSCPDELVPATRFADTRTSPHRAAIDCAAWWGLVQGRTATSYAPARDVSRGQVAAMVARLLQVGGQAPSDVPSAGFDDTVGHLFEDEIDLLASLDIVTGTTAQTYEPNAAIDRAQMASILSRTLANGFDAPLPDGPGDRFDDVSADSVHHDAISRLAAAGITTGTTPTTYSPRRDVTREQMASFVTRVAGVLVADDLLDLPEARPAADDAYASRTRAAWVHLFDSTLKTRSGVRAMVRELDAAGANTIIAQVVRRQDAYYDSDVLPRTPDPDVADGFDVLSELLSAAHARGMEVHAWYSVAPTWHGVYDGYLDDGIPTPDDWVSAEHGHQAPPEDRWVTRHYDEEWIDDPEDPDYPADWDYLDPGVPEVQDHVAEVVGEIAQRYPVDGIHLDYVRYQSAAHGYNPKAVAAYQAERGVSHVPSPSDSDWTAWRRQQTREIIDRARQEIDAAGGDIALSAAVITWQDGPATPDRAGFRATTPYRRVLQDWDQWVRHGAVDAVMPMNYFRAHVSEQSTWFDQWLAYERALAAAEPAQVIPGPGGYLNRPQNGLAQVRAAMSADGAAVYSYQQPTDDGTRAIWDRLAQTRWGYHPVR